MAPFADGPVERRLIPKDATTASAMRLKFVVVDIYFLSEVVLEAFPSTAGEVNFTS
jgi:hypothetical protein